MRFFENLSAKQPQFGAFRDLTGRIASTGYASGLPPWTSMLTLCISQVDSPTRHLTPHLAISTLGDHLEFRYVDTAIKARQWTRAVPSAAGLNRFVSFVDQLNWFGGANRAADSQQSLEGSVNVSRGRAADAGRQYAPAALVGRFWPAPQLHR